MSPRSENKGPGLRRTPVVLPVQPSYFFSVQLNIHFTPKRSVQQPQ